MEKGQEEWWQQGWHCQERICQVALSGDDMMDGSVRRRHVTLLFSDGIVRRGHVIWHCQERLCQMTLSEEDISDDIARR